MVNGAIIACSIIAVLVIGFVIFYIVYTKQKKAADKAAADKVIADAAAKAQKEKNDDLAKINGNPLDANIDSIKLDSTLDELQKKLEEIETTSADDTAKKTDKLMQLQIRKAKLELSQLLSEFSALPTSTKEENKIRYEKKKLIFSKQEEIYKKQLTISTLTEDEKKEINAQIEQNTADKQKWETENKYLFSADEQKAMDKKIKQENEETKKNQDKNLQKRIRDAGLNMMLNTKPTGNPETSLEDKIYRVLQIKQKIYANQQDNESTLSPINSLIFTYIPIQANKNDQFVYDNYIVQPLTNIEVPKDSIVSKSTFPSIQNAEFIGTSEFLKDTKLINYKSSSTDGKQQCINTIDDSVSLFVYVIVDYIDNQIQFLK